MVWFQCEVCGENLKKPKLANHFRMCSAYKLSCIDCGEMFNQESVQNHTQCISEAAKYGPKGQGTVAPNGQTKPDKPKKNADVDINVGLSSRPPWFCSICNLSTTSKQTLLLHADGRKHRAKARAFHASQNPPNQTEPTLNEELVGTGQKVGPDPYKESDAPIAKKRKVEANTTNGEVIQAEQTEESKKKKNGDKIKWKKLISSTLKSSDGVVKTKKLQKLVVKALKESGVTESEEELRDKLMRKISSSSRFITEGKCIRLVTKTEES